MTISSVTVGSHRIAVEARGSGPLVVCSPAMGDTRDAFHPFAVALAERGFRVVIADLRGHGDSDGAADRYGDEATAEDLLAIVDAFGGGPANLVGASMSAAAATIAAGRRPEAVASLVLMSPFLRNGAGAAGRLALRLMLLRPWGPLIWRAYAKTLWPGLDAGAGARAAETTALLTRPGRWRPFTATTHTDHSVVEPWFDRVTAPALVVMGADDPDWKDPAAEAAWAAGRLGGEARMIDGAGHAPMLERSEVVVPIVARFLEEVRDAPRGS